MERCKISECGEAAEDGDCESDKGAEDVHDEDWSTSDCPINSDDDALTSTFDNWIGLVIFLYNYVQCDLLRGT